jgi:hypothetical protein
MNLESAGTQFSRDLIPPEALFCAEQEQQTGTAIDCLLFVF